ncbi:MAG: thioredoxin family protein [Pirellulales bacterium]
MLRLTILLSLSATVILSIPTPSQAGKFNDVLSVGDDAPRFEGLAGVDGKMHSMADYDAVKLVVVVFTCCHSPCATAYEQRLEAIDRDYAGRGVQLVAISVSLHAADQLPAMRERAEKAGWLFPYLHDASQETGRQYGASATPQAFVLDGNRQIRYTGRIDDQIDDVDVKKPYLRQALDALLEGQDPPTTETRPAGCRISYK